MPCAQCFIERFPQLVGQPFGHLARYFADGLVLGLLDRSTGKCTVAPPADTAVRLSPLRVGVPCLGVLWTCLKCYTSLQGVCVCVFAFTHPRL